MMTRRADPRLIAAAATLILAAAIFLGLFFGGLSWDKRALAEASTPEIAEPEEIFLEPELLVEQGEELPEITDQEAAPAPAGEPDPGPVEQRVVEIPSDNPKPAPKVEKPITQTRPSPVKATTPPKSDKEPERATDPTAGKFSASKNGSRNTKKDGAGSSLAGTGVSGAVNGRHFMGCPPPSVSANERSVVKVPVTVNSLGKVVSVGRPTGGTAEQRDRCARQAWKARWSEKPGASDASGILTFTIRPRL